MAYKGKYKIINKEKYIGDISKCIYRSSWERSAFRFCDLSSKVLRWGSEEIKIPYLCDTDREFHLYYVDLIIKFKSGDWWLFEIKPDKETKPPRQNKNKQKYFREVLTWKKNQSKWKYAEEFARKKGMKFKVLTEHDLRSFGIKIL